MISNRYGVSRVYNQQCGYTLLDVQAMHDKMRTMLRSVAAGGLDPSAGKARSVFVGDPGVS
jgi:hypothetical protein